MDHHVFLWGVFGVSVVGMLILDLAVFHRREHEVGMREAVAWSIVWIVTALLFNVLVYFWLGQDLALKFLTAYLVEKSLSVDNLFVFILIFSYFAVPAAYQHKVLFWGIMGALVMRGIFITAGIVLIHFFHWAIYAFGILLILSAFKIAFSKNRQIEPERNPVLRLFRRLLTITEDYEHEKFLVRRAGTLIATPLLVVLVVVESSDLMFAVDSIPAVLAISTDPLIVFSSNIFAILGLRALYFVLHGFMKLFHYLHYGLTLILMFIGVKMLISDVYKIPTSIALLVLGAILTVSIVASLIWPAKENKIAAGNHP